MNKNSKERENISVLIIIAAEISVTEPPYITTNEFISIALLYFHLFHFALGIPFSNILITSSNQNNFIGLSKKGSIFSESTTQSSPTKEEDSETIDPNPFLTFKPIDKLLLCNGIYTQVANEDYHFCPIPNIIPFNRFYLKKYLKTHDETKLFIFFLI